jgi:hypothetical protein
MRRITLVLAAALAISAMLMLATPAFAAGQGHRCISTDQPPPGENSNPCPDDHASEGLGCAAVASGGQTPFLQPAVCIHPVNNL